MGFSILNLYLSIWTSHFLSVNYQSLPVSINITDDIVQVAAHGIFNSQFLSLNLDVSFSQYKLSVIGSFHKAY